MEVTDVLAMYYIKLVISACLTE